FENLLSDTLQDGPTVDAASTIEQAAFEEFLSRHPNVVAYFHGNSNWNEFYEWHGPRGMATLHTFRVDSPMKGKFSAEDETKLSFHVGAIDPVSFRMTVGECLWNQSAGVVWGESATIALKQPATASSATVTRGQ